MKALRLITLSFCLLPFLGRVYGSFDPNYIVLEEPEAEILAELPSGNVNLKSFRADSQLINTYSKENNILEGDKKDFAKAPDCTRAEIYALMQWTENELFRRLNPALRKLHLGQVDGKPMDIELEHATLMISSGINCAPQYEGAVVRLEETPAQILSQYEEKNYIVFRGFTSTTKGEVPASSIAAEVSRHQKILIYNAKGADIDVLGISRWNKEKEVLIRPGTVFQVVSRKPLAPGSPIWNEFIFEQYFH